MGLLLKRRLILIVDRDAQRTALFGENTNVIDQSVRDCVIRLWERISLNVFFINSSDLTLLDTAQNVSAVYF